MTVYIYFIWGKYLAQTIFNMQVSSEVFDKPDTGTLQQYYYFRTLNSIFEAFDKTTPCTSSVTHVWLINIDFLSLCTQNCGLWRCGMHCNNIIICLSQNFKLQIKTLILFFIMQKAPASLTICNRLCIQHVQGCDGQMRVASLAMN